MSSFPEGRFYEAEFPELEEIVFVQVKRIVDMGAYVTLLEYNGKEGMMLLTELSKRRIRSVWKLLRIGRYEICMILRVDREKGYIDLSKRRVDLQDARAKEEKFAKAKAVHAIMRHVAATHKIQVEELCKKVSWPLFKKYADTREAYEVLKRHINGELNFWEQVDFSKPGQDLSHLADKLKADIEATLRRRLLQQQLRLRAKIEVSCSTYEGIEAVKEALNRGFEVSREDCEVKINLVAHPLFVITCLAPDKETGIKVLSDAMELIQVSIKEKGGSFVVRSRPELAGQGEEEFGSDSDDDSSDDDDEGGIINQEAMPALSEEAMKQLLREGDDDDDDDESAGEEEK